MLILPVGVAGNILDPARVTVKDSLAVATVGCLVFGVGWLLQRAAHQR
jgi:hypothetical protein